MYLLFFDTFAHEASDVPSKLDLVQFPKPVQVSEVRVIPLGARVQADFPGGFRLGATNPSQFEIDFFVNDLGKRGAATFEKVGQLQYDQQGAINLEFDKKPPTDGLLLRGAYNTITLAVYGCLGKVSRDPPPPATAGTVPPPLSPPPPHTANPSAVASTLPPPQQQQLNRNKRDDAVATAPLSHPLPEKVNPNERIRDWLQDTQVPHSPLDLDASPAKVWGDQDDPSYDSDLPVPGFQKDSMSPSQDVSMPHSPPGSPPPSPPTFPIPLEDASCSSPPPPPRETSSSKRRSRENSRQRAPIDVVTSERSSHDRSRERSSRESKSHERSRERSDHDGEKTKRSRDKSRRRSRERSREQSQHRSVSITRTHTADVRESNSAAVEPDITAHSSSRDGREGSTKDRKRSRESRRNKEDKREHRRKSSDSWEEVETSRKHRRKSYNSSDSPHHEGAGPRTPPPPKDWGPDSPAVPSDALRESRDRDKNRESSVSKKAKLEEVENDEISNRATAGMLFAEEEMEAISDDEDIPDLPADDSQDTTLIGDTTENMATGVEGTAKNSSEGVAAPGVDTIDASTHGLAGAPGDLDFEEIMSDEEELPEYQEFEEEGVDDYIVEEWEVWLKPYPSLLDQFVSVAPLVHLTSPALTLAQATFIKRGADTETGTKLINIAEAVILPTVSSSDEEKESFVHVCEQLIAILPRAISGLSKEKYINILTKLCSLIEVGLNMDVAMSQPQPVYKIRHLKVGLRLCICLCQCDDEVTRKLLSTLPIVSLLCGLYNMTYMAQSIKLLILRCIDCILSCRTGIELFLGVQPKLEQTGYEIILQLLSSTTHTRAKVCAAAIIRKLHLFEVMEKLRADTSTLHNIVFPASVLDRPEDATKGVCGAPGAVDIAEDQEDSSEKPFSTSADCIEEPSQHSEEGKIEKMEESEWCDDVMDDAALADDDTAMEESYDDKGESVTVPRPLVTSITSCLQHILHTLKHVEQLLSQPHRYLPVGKQFQVPKCQYNIMQEVFLLMDHASLMDSVADLLTALSLDIQIPPLGNHDALDASEEPQLLSVLGLTLELLTVISDSNEGLTYLTAHHGATTAMLRGLIKLYSRSSSLQRPHSCPLHHNFFQCKDSCVFINEFVSRMIERLYALHQLDSLAFLNSSSTSSGGDNSDLPDLQQSLVHLHSLAGMLLSLRSKVSLAKVLTTGDYMDIVLPYLNAYSDGDTFESAPLKAACVGYATDIVSAAVKYDGNMHFLERYADSLCKIIEKETAREGSCPEDSCKLQELLPWLNIARKPESFSYDNISQLVDIVKEQLEEVDKLPGALFSSLRIIKSLAIPPYSSISSISESASDDGNKPEDVIEELKYKYAVVQLFYSDLTAHLNSLLTKLCSLYPQPGLHCSLFSGSHGPFIINLLEPSLSLLYCLLHQVIHARGAAYHDLSSVQPLLSVYLLLSAFTTNGPEFPMAKNNPSSTLSVQLPCKLKSSALTLQKKVIQTLLLFTLPGQQQETQCNSSSLWSQLIAQVLKFIESAPHTMVPGLCLLTELLPLPLPIVGRPLTEGEQERCVAVRKLWALNLAPLSESIYRLLHNLSAGVSSSLTHALRRACIALADLAPQMAELVIRPILDECVVLSKGLSEGGCNAVPLRQQLYILASLSSHPGCKAAILHLLMTDSYNALLSLWCGAVTATLQDNFEFADSSIASLFAPLVLLFHHLCNIHNNMQKELDTDKLWGVPCKEILTPIVESLVVLLSLSSFEYTVYQALLATFNDLLLHDFGVYLLKNALDKNRASFIPLLTKIATDLSSNSANEMILPILESFLDFIKGLQYPDSVNQCLFKSEQFGALRSISVTATEICHIIGWSVSDNKERNDELLKQRSEELSVHTVKDSKDPFDSIEKSNNERASDEASPTDNKTEALSKFCHPLKNIEENIENVASSEVVVERLYCRVNDLISMLMNENNAPDSAEQISVTSASISSSGKGTDSSSTPSGTDGPSVGPCSAVGSGGRSLSEQYEKRQLWVQLTPQLSSDSASCLWLQQPPSLYSNSDTSDTDTDMVSISLSDLLRDCAAADFDLEVSVQKLLRGHHASLSLQKGSQLNKTSQKFKPSAAPVRPGGRGVRPYGFVSRGPNLRADPFRCRPPNTSRPPSLHVDDFVALESTGHQPTGPTGYNRISFGRGKMLLDSMRGRGGVRGMISRGGDTRGGPGGPFIYRPTGYRPDFNRGMMGGRGVRWSFRGSDPSMMRGGAGAGAGQYRPQGGMRFMRGRNMFTRGDRGSRHLRPNFH